MGFYVGKGLQLAGLAGVGAALVIGLVTGELVREIFLAALGMGLFYVGQRIES